MVQFYKNIRSKISKTSTAALSAILVVSGMLITILWMGFSPQPFSIRLADVVVFCFVLLIWGSVGLLQIVRKETPFFFGSVEGPVAVITGWIILAAAWGTAIFFVVSYLSGLKK